MNSVIVPCYNSEKTIDRLMNSIPDDWQVIVVDDCSKTQVKPDRADIYIRLYENHGPGFARNIGLGFAKGEYVFFADADDEIIKFDWKPYLNHDIVYSGFEDNINGTDTPKLTKPFGCIYGVAYRRKFLVDNNIQFPPWIQREDIVFNTICQALTDDWATVYAGTYRRYVTQGSITTTRDFNKTELPYLAKEIVYVWEFLNGSETAKKLCTRTFCYMYWLYQTLSLNETEKQEFKTEVKKVIEKKIDFVDLKKYLAKNKEAVFERLGKVNETMTLRQFFKEFK